MAIQKVYIASPLFNPKEREENEEIDLALRDAGYRTFLPQRDGFLFVDVVSALNDRGLTLQDARGAARHLIFLLDVFQVCEACDATVLNMNGRVPDEGGVVEGALTFMSGHPLVIYKSDDRSLIMGEDNPLVIGLSGFETVREIRMIPPKLKELDTAPVSYFSQTLAAARHLLKEDGQMNLNDLVEAARLLWEEKQIA